MKDHNDLYSDYFNPDDISRWESKSPIEFTTSVMPVINEKIQAIGEIAERLKKVPGIDQIREEQWPSDISVPGLLDMIIQETFSINRILRTWTAYRRQYLEDHPLDDGIV